MPPAPDVSLLTRYLFENPWPLAVALVAIAAIIAWHALRESLVKRVRWSLLLFLLAAVALLAGWLVETPGERGESITRAFVERAIANDLVGAVNLLSDDATLAVGSPKNPGTDRDAIIGGVSTLRQRFAIESNTISMLKGYALPDGRAEVHLACWTDVGYGPTPSQWVLHLGLQQDGEWKIERITCISIANQPAPDIARLIR